MKERVKRLDVGEHFLDDKYIFKYSPVWDRSWDAVNRVAATPSRGRYGVD